MNNIVKVAMFPTFDDFEAIADVVKSELGELCTRSDYDRDNEAIDLYCTGINEFTHVYVSYFGIIITLQSKGEVTITPRSVERKTYQEVADIIKKHLGVGA